MTIKGVVIGDLDPQLARQVQRFVQLKLEERKQLRADVADCMTAWPKWYEKIDGMDCGAIKTERTAMKIGDRSAVTSTVESDRRRAPEPSIAAPILQDWMAVAIPNRDGNW